LIVRFPAKWSHLAPARPGQTVDDPVSFVDFAPTVLSLCGAPIPSYYQGRAFLGDCKAAPREHVFLYRARMDERYDTVRAVRDRRFRYVRNYSPHRPWGQHYAYPFAVLSSMRSWHAEFTAGRCNAVQAAYWLPKPGEEFYDIEDDPFEVRNRVTDEAFAEQVAVMRAKLRAEILTSRDAGFIPEGMIARLAGEKTIHEYAQSDAYPLERILDLADKASDRKAAHLPDFIAAMNDPHPVVRYWAATGCLILQDKAAPAQAQLETQLTDDWQDVRVVAAEALAYFGNREAAAGTIADALKSENYYESLAAQNALDYMVRSGHVPLAAAQSLVRDLKFPEPDNYLVEYLLNQ
jgi:hypothetical protein